MKDQLKELEDIIELTYSEGVTLDEAEKLAARFLHAQLSVSRELAKYDLDARMRKSGLKAVRSAVYLDKRSNPEGKPTEAALAAMVDTDVIVQGEQDAFDKAEVERDELERYYSVFAQAHVYYRQISKAAFNG